jgi:transcriptional regulator with XRE-family HTH domain
MGRKPKTASEKLEEERHLKRLGEHLKELRETKKLTVKALADKLGVKPQYIYMIEKGKAKPSESRLNDLARALGDLADEFLMTAVSHVEDEFATRLKEAGLSPEEIEEAAKRVSARAKQDVVSGKEPLRVARGQASEEQILGAFEEGEEIVAMDSMSPQVSVDKSASSYAKSVRDQFAASSSPRRSGAAAAAAAAGMAPGGKSQTIKAGPEARIVIDRQVSREERKGLQDIGRVIAHLLKK